MKKRYYLVGSVVFVLLFLMRNKKAAVAEIVPNTVRESQLIDLSDDLKDEDGNLSLESSDLKTENVDKKDAKTGISTVSSGVSTNTVDKVSGVFINRDNSGSVQSPISTEKR